MCTHWSEDKREMHDNIYMWEVLEDLVSNLHTAMAYWIERYREEKQDKPSEKHGYRGRNIRTLFQHPWSQTI